MATKPLPDPLARREAAITAGPASPSVRARLVSLYARAAIKPHSRGGFEVLWARRRLERPLLPSRAPKGFTVTREVTGGVVCEWIRPEAPAEPRPTVLYLHGGGYYFGSSRSHRAITFALARRTGWEVVVPDYRLAPEHPFPAALEDALACARAIAPGPRAPWVICGDSAGGGLALSLMARLRDDAAAQACAGVLFSPWTDLAATGRSLRENQRRDAIFGPGCIAADAAHYLSGHDPGDPGVSPLYGDLSGLPPLLIQVSASEVLLDDALRLAAGVRAASGRVDCQVWTDLPHVWQLHVGVIPEARHALQIAGEFIVQVAPLPPAGRVDSAGDL